jgi:hypothetical protein
MAVEMERCHLWLGRFSDRTEVDDYFEEEAPYPEDRPISLFAADQGKRFYDHDWVFAEFRESGDLHAILGAIRAPDATREAVLRAAAALGFACNTIVVADEGEFVDPVSVAGPPRLEYIGSHPFWVRTHMPNTAPPDTGTGRTHENHPNYV